MADLSSLQGSEIDRHRIVPILFYKTQAHHAVELSLILRVLKVPYRLRTSPEQDNISLIKTLDPNCNNPIMYDENNDLYLSDQSAIIDYLLETYDFHGLQSRYTAAVETLTKLRPGNALLHDFQEVVEDGLSMLENVLTDRLPRMNLDAMTIMGKTSSYVDILFLCWIFVFVNGRSPEPFTRSYPLVHKWWTRLVGSKVVNNVFALCVPAKERKEERTTAQVA
ncbi:hypothetical protein F5Y03DRAFT_403031 [Xylaria venustula]|nr:hypothetical protein F5Y03DRAFT_403031 [Xylaria venustula]